MATQWKDMPDKRNVRTMNGDHVLTLCPFLSSTLSPCFSLSEEEEEQQAHSKCALAIISLCVKSCLFELKDILRARAIFVLGNIYVKSDCSIGIWLSLHASCFPCDASAEEWLIVNRPYNQDWLEVMGWWNVISRFVQVYKWANQNIVSMCCW